MAHALVAVSDSADSVLTVDDTGTGGDTSGFSITFDSLNLNSGGTAAFGEFSAAELAALGIDVGT